MSAFCTKRRPGSSAATTLVPSWALADRHRNNNMLSDHHRSQPRKGIMKSRLAERQVTRSHACSVAYYTAPCTAGNISKLKQQAEAATQAPIYLMRCAVVFAHVLSLSTAGGKYMYATHHVAKPSSILCPEPAAPLATEPPKTTCIIVLTSMSLRIEEELDMRCEAKAHALYRQQVVCLPTEEAATRRKRCGLGLGCCC